MTISLDNSFAKRSRAHEAASPSTSSTYPMEKIGGESDEKEEGKVGDRDRGRGKWALNRSSCQLCKYFVAKVQIEMLSINRST